VKSRIYYEFSSLIYNWLSGNWEKAKEYDYNLVELNVRIGEVFFTVFCCSHYSFFSTERGYLTDAHEMMYKISEIADMYEHDFTRALKYTWNTKLLMKCRKLHEGLLESEEGIDFTTRIGENVQLFSQYSFRARIQIMMGDIQGAENSLSSAREINLERMVPLFLTDYSLSQFVFNMYRLEEEIKDNNNSKLSEYQMIALKSGRKAVKISRKAAGDRTEAFKLMGTYFWITAKQSKARKWWSKSITEGERLGARLELSRTYFEVGKRLLEPKSNFKKLHGIKGEDYLEKARTMFQEMDLQWDLDQLDKIVSVS
jgi:hypothetical protein